MKKILIPLFVLTFLFFKAEKVNAGVVNYPAETNILLTTPNITLVVQTGSSADSVTVSDSNIVVTVSAPDYFILRSDNKYNLANNGGVGINCGPLVSTITIQPSSGQQTVTITPSTQTCTPAASTSSSNSSSSSSSSSSGSSGCNDSVTTGTPDLFEIRTTKNFATLFFTPPASNYSKFYIAYGRNSDVSEYGVEFNQNPTGGVTNYTINYLGQNTKYYFKIRPGNGCATGNWGNTMSSNTTTGNSKKTYYKNIFVPVITTFNNFVKTVTKAVTQKQENVISPVPEKTNNTPTENNSVQPVISNQAVAPSMPGKQKTCFLWIFCW